LDEGVWVNFSNAGLPALMVSVIRNSINRISNARAGA
jgi:hypothetical protein